MAGNSTQDYKIQALPFSVYFWVAAALVFAGLLDAVYLSVSHYRVYTDVAYKSFCAVSRSINCDTVSQSPYSILLWMPVPVWGIFGYAFLGLLVLLAGSPAAGRTRMWALVCVVSLGFSLYSLVLAFISSVYIHSYCLMCIVSYAINLLILYYSWLIIRRFVPEGILGGLKSDIRFLLQAKRRVLPVVTAFLLAVGLSWALIPNYWDMSDAEILEIDIPQGVTEEGYAWLGSEDPVLVITEFSDYLCFQCRKMHNYLRQMMAENPGKIRLVHRHFPMQQGINPLVNEPYHTGAGPMALLAIYATGLGKFKEMNDLLFDMAAFHQDFSTQLVADRLDLDSGRLTAALKDRRLFMRLQKDIRDGLNLGITGTPGFVIDGKVYQGYIPPEVLSRVMN